MAKSYLTREDIDKNVLVSDVLIGMKSLFFGQENNIRQFVVYPRDKEPVYCFVNMDRNEWFTSNPVMKGKATDLLEKVFNIKIDDEVINTTFKLMSGLLQNPRPSTFMFDPADIIKVEMDINLIDDNNIMSPLYMMGISQSLAYKFMMQGTFTGIRDNQEHHALLFPNSSGGYYSMNERGWRTVGEDGISLLGPTKECQRLCVFDSPLDFLALQQMRHIKGADVFFSTDRYLIINGKKNLDDALGHVSTHPEYYHVCCFFPITDQGVKLFAKFRDICQGTAVDSSRLYTGHTSLADSLDYEQIARRREGFMVMKSKISAAIEREQRAKAAAEKQAQAQAAKQQQTQTPAAKKQQPKVQNVPQTATVRDTPKPKSETTTTTQKVATDDDRPKRGFGR